MIFNYGYQPEATRNELESANLLLEDNFKPYMPLSFGKRRCTHTTKKGFSVARAFPFFHLL